MYRKEAETPEMPPPLIQNNQIICRETQQGNGQDFKDFGHYHVT